MQNDDVCGGLDWIGNVFAKRLTDVQHNSQQVLGGDRQQ
jgi:hypothetical protein